MHEGAALLGEWIERRGFGTQHRAAEFLGISDGLLSMLLSGTRRPGRDLSVRMQESTGIPVSAWVVKSASSSVKTKQRRRSSKPVSPTVNSHA